LFYTCKIVSGNQLRELGSQWRDEEDDLRQVRSDGIVVGGSDRRGAR